MAAAWRELQFVLDEELARLPGRYREAVVLCGLQDLTQEEAAARLGCPVGTVKSRLTRGRELLRARLVRRGITPAAAGLALTLAADPGPAASTRLMESTMALTSHPGPAAAATRLADAVLRSALRAKLAGGGVVAAVILAGVAWAAGPGQRTPPVPPPPVAATGPAEAARRRTPPVTRCRPGRPPAWGRPASGTCTPSGVSPSPPTARRSSPGPGTGPRESGPCRAAKSCGGSPSRS